MAETWVINDGCYGNNRDQSYTINFSSNGNNYTSLWIHNTVVPYMEPYDGIMYNDTTVAGVDVDASLRFTNEAYRTVTFETAPTGDLLAWLQENAEKQVPQISIDLTTLTGWANVSAGAHTLGIKAKATGYADSVAATAQVTKAASGYTLTISTNGNPNVVNYPIFINGSVTPIYPSTSGDVIVNNIITVQIGQGTENYASNATLNGIGIGYSDRIPITLTQDSEIYIWSNEIE